MPPETSADREIFADLPGKKEARKTLKRGANGKEKKEKGRWKIENGSRESLKMRRGPFFFWLPKWKFSSGKKHFTPGKIQEK